MSSMSIEVAPRWSLPPPIVACEAKTRISAIRSWWISRSIASAARCRSSSRVRAQVGEFGLRDQSAARLRFGQRDPHGAPEPPALVLGEQRAKFGAPVSPRERRGVGAVIHGSRCPFRPAGSPASSPYEDCE